MVRAEHSSEVSYKDDGDKSTMGPGVELAGYILKLEDGYTIYIAGDTCVFGDMKFIADYYKPDLAFLPNAAYSVTEMVEALERVAAAKGITLCPITPRPDADIEAIVQSWPQAMEDTRASALGLPRDESLDRIIEEFIEDWL